MVTLWRIVRTMWKNKAKIVAAVVAVIAGMVLYKTYFDKKKEEKRARGESDEPEESKWDTN